MPALALSLLGGEERVRPRVRDDHPAFRLGEQDGIRRGVDDVQQELALALQPVLAFEDGRGGAQASDLLSEQLGRPLRFRLAASGTHEQKALPRFPFLGERKRDGDEVAPPRVGPVAPAFLADHHRLAARQREYEGMLGVLHREMQGLDLSRGDAARRDVLHGPRPGLDQRADGFAGADALRQPVDRRARAFHRLLAEEQKLRQRKPRRRRRLARRLGAGA